MRIANKKHAVKDHEDFIDTSDVRGEVVEIKLRSSLRPYRILVNKLIEGYQEIVDGDKYRFIEALNEVFEFAQRSPQSTRARTRA